MAQPTNTFDQYDSVGNREDLLDTIYCLKLIVSEFIFNELSIVILI